MLRKFRSGGNRRAQVTEVDGNESGDVTGARRRGDGRDGEADGGFGFVLVLALARVVANTLALALVRAGLNAPGFLEQPRDRAGGLDRRHHRPRRALTGVDLAPREVQQFLRDLAMA